MNTFKTQNLHTAAALSAFSDCYDIFFNGFTGGDASAMSDHIQKMLHVDIDPENLKKLAYDGRRAGVALEAICMSHLIDEFIKSTGDKLAFAMPDVILKAILSKGPVVFDDIQIGGLILKHKRDLDLVLRQFKK